MGDRRFLGTAVTLSCARVGVMERVGEEAADVPAAGEAYEREAAVGRVGGRCAVPVAVLGMVVPSPRDDGLLRYPAEEVHQRLAIAVPQFLPGHRTAHGAPGDLAHHGSPGQVEPDDGIRAGPDN